MKTPKPSWAFFEFGKDATKDIAYATSLEGKEVHGYDVSYFSCQRQMSDASFDKDSRGSSWCFTAHMSAKAIGSNSNGSILIAINWVLRKNLPPRSEA